MKVPFKDLPGTAGGGFGLFIPMETLEGALTMRRVFQRMTRGMVGERLYVYLVENTDVTILDEYGEK